MKKSKTIFTAKIKDFGDYWRDVDFFLRLHRHLPDYICGKSPVGKCFYRIDGKAINRQNDYVDKLQQNPEFVKKEKEIDEAVKNQKSIFTPQ